MKAKCVIVSLSVLIFANGKTLAESGKQGNADSKQIVAYCLARGQEHGQKENWKGIENYLAATKLILVTLGSKAYTYSRDGKLVKSGKAIHPSAGIIGDYAESGWEYLDKNNKIFSDMLGHYLLRKVGGKWKLEAEGGTDGYDQDRALQKAHVPENIQKRLKYR